ncbi:hypothetical protein EDB85DRAFT_1818012, partial [Lactarius pseudohatsudake]
LTNLLCMAKSGCQWTPNDLLAYNIDVVYQNTAAFFGPGELPLPQVDEELLNTLEAADMQTLT